MAVPMYWGKAKGCSFVTGSTCSFTPEYSTAANKACDFLGNLQALTYIISSESACKYWTEDYLTNKYDC
jgi:hypothetical protein